MKIRGKKRSQIAEEFKEIFVSYGFRNDAPYKQPIKYMLELMEEEGRLFYYGRLNCAINNRHENLTDLLNDIEATKEDMECWPIGQVDTIMLESLEAIYKSN